MFKKTQLMQLHLIIPISLLILICISCNRTQSSHESELNEANFSPLLVVSSFLIENVDASLKSDLPISHIADIKADNAGSLIILDSSTYQLLKLSTDGSYEYHSLPQGNGPMEFKRPRTLAIGDDNSIFVSDDALLKVVHLDSNFNFLNSYPVKHRVSNMLVDSGSLFTLSFGMFRRGVPGIIDRYQLTDPNLVSNPLGTASDIDNDQLRAMAGFTDRLFEVNNDLILMRWYPYQLTWYTKDGDSLRSYARGIEWFEAPRRSSTGVVEFSSGLRSVGEWCPNRCYTVVRYFQYQDGEMNYFWDIFNDFESEPITFKENYFLDAQPNNILFRDSEIIAQYNEPQPHVKVYAQELE